MKRPLSRGGFSLTELLVVVAIILILVSLIFVVGERMYARTLQVQCQSRLEKIGNALQMYANEYAGQMPKPWDPYSGRLWFQTLVADERLEGPQILTCPVVGKPPAMAHGPGIAPKRRYCVDEYLRALYWLRHIQEETGQFPALECDKSWHQYPKVMTGFALMAYFGYGCTDRRPAEFAETVRKGVEFLCSSQGQYKSGEDKGKFKVRGAHIYGQGICLMALSEAVRTVEDPALRAQAQAAVQLGMDWLADEQPWHGCFTYNGPAIAEYDEDLVWYDDEGEEQVGKWVGTRADTSACGWAYQGVGAARLAGVNAPSEVMDKAQVFLDYMAQTNGKIGYRFWPLPDGSGTSDWLTHRHTSIGMLARLMLDESPGSSVVQSQLNYVTQDKDGVPVHIYNFTHPEGQYMKPGKATDRYQFYHTTRALRAIGGSHWTTWRDGDPGIVAHDQEWEGYPKWVLLHLIDDGVDAAGNPMSHWPGSAADGSQFSGSGHGTTWGTAFSLCMLAASYDEFPLDEEFTPTTAEDCSYGYNNRLGHHRGRPAGDTIVVMDYSKWEIDHDENDPEKNDSLGEVATRHSDRANALMGDGSVRAFYVDDIREGMWTPDPGD